MTQTTTPAAQPTLFEQPFTTQIQTVRVADIKSPDTKKVKPSVAKLGILQPVLLQPCASGPYLYEVVEGARRTNSAIHYGLQTIPALITDGGAAQLAAARLSANLDRSENPLPEARALQKILHSGVYADHKSMAQDLGLPLTKIKGLLKLAKLPEDLLKGLEEKKLSLGSAKAITKLAPQYREQAIITYREKVAQGEEFTPADVQAVKIRRTGDLNSLLGNSLQSLPSLKPLLEVPPAQLLATDVQRMAQGRNVSLNDLIAELQKLEKGVGQSQVSQSQVSTPKSQVSTPKPTAFPNPIPAPPFSAELEAKAEAITPSEEDAPFLTEQALPEAFLTADSFQAGEDTTDLSDPFGLDELLSTQATEATPAAEMEPSPSTELPAAFMQAAPAPRLKTTIPRSR